MAEASQEVYFDKNKNLLFIMHDKKATSGTKYKTIGWVIKRYDDAITAPGQYCARFGNANCLYQMDDPEDSAYVYTAFVVYADTILARIGQVSSEWRTQLVNYGGYVYLDAIMTVLVNGVPQGSIDYYGQGSGEVYETYEGIRNARGWASPESLKEYYGLKLKYPYTVPSGTLSLTDVSVKTGTHSSGTSSSFTVGGGTKEKQTYQVGQGIPSGEQLYILGQADSYRYDISYQTVSGYASVPVQVVTNYELRWTDTQGRARSETQQVTRLYMVTRSYEYIKVGNIKLYGLKSILFDGQCFNDVTQSVNGGIPSYYLVHADGSSNHVAVNGTTTYQVGTVVVNSGNNQRPSIPNDNQSAYAEKAVNQLYVWSDSLQLDGVTLLSNKKGSGKGMQWNSGSNISQKSIYITAITIPSDTLNQSGYETIAKMNYQATDSSMYYQVNKNINKVTVHTPVVANMVCSGYKDQNENLTPGAYDVVIGDRAVLALTGVGMHRNILGYGSRSYIGYVKKIYVKFPFEIYYKNKKYAGNQWVEVGTNLANIVVPESVAEGNYTAECMVAAVNTPAYYLTPDQLESVAETGANLQVGNYAAKNSYELHAIGKLYGFTVALGEKRYAAGVNAEFPENLSCESEILPVNIEKKEEKNLDVRVGVYANAIGDSEDECIDMDISYYVLEGNAEEGYSRCAVDVYAAQDESFTADILTLLQREVLIPASEARRVKAGVYYYESALDIPDNLVVVPAGTDISDIDMFSDYILRDRQIIVHAEVYGADGSGRKLSYENAENARDGYCNMWAYEGYNIDNAGDLPVEYGDILLLNMEGTMKNSGIVIGTH